MSTAFNDRAWLLERQHEAQTQRNMEMQANHYSELGVGMAAFCVAMYTTLVEEEKHTFTLDEALRLVEAAVRGR